MWYGWHCPHWNFRQSFCAFLLKSTLEPLYEGAGNMGSFSEHHEDTHGGNQKLLNWPSTLGSRGVGGEKSEKAFTSSPTAILMRYREWFHERSKFPTSIVDLVAVIMQLQPRRTEWNGASMTSSTANSTPGEPCSQIDPFSTRVTWLKWRKHRHANVK